MNSEPTFVKVLETDSLTDIALIKSVLDAEGVSYFLQGENMKFIQPPYGSTVLMVAEKDIKKAVELLKPLKLSYVWMIFQSKE